jgi:hypothetical protein
MGTSTIVWLSVAVICNFQSAVLDQKQVPVSIGQIWKEGSE